MDNRQKKKEYMDDYNAKYYAKNRVRISEMMKETVHCKVCNIDTNKHNFPRHEKTTKHQALIEKQEKKKENKDIDSAVRRALVQMVKGKI